MLALTLTLLALIPSAPALFFGGAGSGGCQQQACPPPQSCVPQQQACPPCQQQACPPPCPPMPQLSLPCPPCHCAPPLQLPQFSLPCFPPPCACRRRKRSANPLIIAEDGVSSDSLCNNNEIRKIILKNLNSDPKISKEAIHSELKAKQRGNFVVICSQANFSFIADSTQFCVDGSPTQTCYVFEI